MTLTEVPPRRLIEWGAWWMPYAARVADREGCELSEYVGEALSGVARVFVIWDDEGKPTGATATRLLMRNGREPVGELHWLAGDGMSAWLPVCFPILKQILIRDYGVKILKTTGRTGLERAFKPLGFHRAKVILEMRLDNDD